MRRGTCLPKASSSGTQADGVDVAVSNLRTLRTKAFLRYLFDVNMIYLAENVAIVFVFALVIGYQRLQGEGGDIGIVLIIFAILYFVLVPLISSVFYWGYFLLSKEWRARYKAATTYGDLQLLGRELVGKFPRRR